MVLYECFMIESHGYFSLNRYLSDSFTALSINCLPNTLMLEYCCYLFVDNSLMMISCRLGGSILDPGFLKKFLKKYCQIFSN